MCLSLVCCCPFPGKASAEKTAVTGKAFAEETPVTRSTCKKGTQAASFQALHTGFVNLLTRCLQKNQTCAGIFTTLSGLGVCTDLEKGWSPSLGSRDHRSLLRLQSPGGWGLLPSQMRSPPRSRPGDERDKMGVLKAARLLSNMHVVPNAALAHVLLPDVVAFDAMLVP